jgi:hypothetical protein
VRDDILWHELDDRRQAEEERQECVERVCPVPEPWVPAAEGRNARIEYLQDEIFGLRWLIQDNRRRGGRLEEVARYAEVKIKEAKQELEGLRNENQ